MLLVIKCKSNTVKVMYWTNLSRIFLHYSLQQYDNIKLLHAATFVNWATKRKRGTKTKFLNYKDNTLTWLRLAPIGFIIIENNYFRHSWHLFVAGLKPLALSIIFQLISKCFPSSFNFHVCGFMRWVSVSYVIVV